MGWCGHSVIPWRLAAEGRWSGEGSTLCIGPPKEQGHRPPARVVVLAMESRQRAHAHLRSPPVRRALLPCPASSVAMDDGTAVGPREGRNSRNREGGLTRAWRTDTEQAREPEGAQKGRSRSAAQGKWGGKRLFL
jgi:hypothetical protein